MNRTIKFRGKSIYDEEWLYGSLVKIEKDRYAVIPPLNDIEIGRSIGMYEVCLDHRPVHRIIRWDRQRNLRR